MRTDDRLGPDPNGELANANSRWNGLIFPGFNPFVIPLGAYPDTTSPWGLLDVAGAAKEWTEAAFQLLDEPYPRDRYLEGSSWDTGGGQNSDRASVRGGSAWPTFRDDTFGLRIASAVPTPGGIVLLLSIGVAGLTRRPQRVVQPVPS